MKNPHQARRTVGSKSLPDLCTLLEGTTYHSGFMGRVQSKFGRRVVIRESGRLPPQSAAW